MPYKRLHVPGWITGADPENIIFKNFNALRRVNNLGMELNTVYLFGLVVDCSKWRIRAVGYGLKTGRKIRYTVTMAHPDLNGRMGIKPVKLILCFVNCKFGFSVFSLFVGFNFSFLNVAKELHAVAYPENRNSNLKNIS